MLAYVCIVVLSRFLGVLPLGLALALGRALGTFAFHVVRIRRSVVVSNIRHCLGATRSEAEVWALARDCYRQFGMTFVELLRSMAGRSTGLERNVEFDPLDPFVALRDGKKPVVIIQPHAGNFDLVAYAFAARGFPHHTVMKALHNERVNEMIVRTRERHGVIVHLKGSDSYEELLNVLRSGAWAGLLPDQNAKQRGVTVSFLGQPASIFKGPALLHLETGAPICVAVDERLASDPRRHHVHFGFLAPRPRTGDDAADVRAIMQDVSDAMTVHILRNPSQYFWFHRLWGKDVAAGRTAAAS